MANRRHRRDRRFHQRRAADARRVRRRVPVRRIARRNRDPPHRADAGQVLLRRRLRPHPARQNSVPRPAATPPRPATGARPVRLTAAAHDRRPPRRHDHRASGNFPRRLQDDRRDRKRRRSLRRAHDPAARSAASPLTPAIVVTLATPADATVSPLLQTLELTGEPTP